MHQEKLREKENVVKKQNAIEDHFMKCRVEHSQNSWEITKLEKKLQETKNQIAPAERQLRQIFSEISVEKGKRDSYNRRSKSMQKSLDALHKSIGGVLEEQNRSKISKSSQNFEADGDDDKLSKSRVEELEEQHGVVAETSFSENFLISIFYFNFF